MSKVKRAIIKYTPYALFLVGIVIFITFFIAGGIRTNQEIYHPNGLGGYYHFTIFQALFGKTLYYTGYKATYFKFNLLGILVIPSLVVGIILSTINRVKYKTRNLISGFCLIITSFVLFLIPSTTNLGEAWYVDEYSIIVTMGPPLIIAAVITGLMGITYFVLAFLKEIK